MKKLMNTIIILYQACMYFNMYMLKSIFFGGGIMQISEKQCDELEKTHEVLILVKLQLSKTFPRKLMYARKSFLGLGLLPPETILAIQIIKLYIRYRCVK